MNRLLLLLGLAGLLAATGCRKDDVVDCTPTTTPNALEDFTRRNGAPVQTFTVPLGIIGSIPQVVTTSSGAGITIPTTSFLLPSGAMATGTAQVRVREIYSVADMILSNMPTTRGGSRKLLISGGEFSIQVWQNGVRLRLMPGARVVVRSLVPAGAGSGQQSLWQQPASRLLGDSAGWVPPTPIPPSGFPSRSDTIRTTGTPPIYQTSIPLDSVSWWNIDRLWQQYQAAPVGTVTVQFPALPAGSVGSTRIFLRPVGFNGLISPYITSAQVSWSGQLPTGASMVAAVLQSINGQLYFGSQPFTTQTSSTVAPALTAVSEADAVRLIKQL
ncbi:MAG: hypothetical protein EOO36_06275 [Cytophagaceae bacterium]|nr:MAG: hypothetical protein EOO36_06275 [Cytophagaceae bacterium]